MKNILRNLILSLSLVLLPALFLAPSAAAVNVFQPCTSTSSSGASGSDVCGEVGSQSSSGSDPVINVLKIAINIISLIVGVASVIIIIISGLRMTLSSGDPKAAAAARSGVIYALVGIVITLSAQAIVLFVLDKVS